MITLINATKQLVINGPELVIIVAGVFRIMRFTQTNHLIALVAASRSKVNVIITGNKQLIVVVRIMPMQTTILVEELGLDLGVIHLHVLNLPVFQPGPEHSHPLGGLGIGSPRSSRSVSTTTAAPNSDEVSVCDAAGEFLILGPSGPCNIVLQLGAPLLVG